MKSHQQAFDQENTLLAAKKARQEKSRALVRAGQVSQQSMFLIQPATARAVKVVHRVLSFD
jgi:hypothetical protein